MWSSLGIDWEAAQGSLLGDILSIGLADSCTGIWKKLLKRTHTRNWETGTADKEIQPVHPKGDQSWVFTGRTDAEVETPILWPPHAKS